MAARVEVNILLAFLHWVRIALHPWPFVSDIAIFVLKGDVELQLTNFVSLNYLSISDYSSSFWCPLHLWCKPVRISQKIRCYRWLHCATYVGISLSLCSWTKRIFYFWKSVDYVYFTSSVSSWLISSACHRCLVSMPFQLSYSKRSWWNWNQVVWPSTSASCCLKHLVFSLFRHFTGHPADRKPQKRVFADNLMSFMSRKSQPAMLVHCPYVFCLSLSHSL